MRVTLNSLFSGAPDCGIKEIIMRNQRRIEPEDLTPYWQKLYDIADLEALMQGTARSGKPISYSEALDCLGFAFSRPKMRALCVALGEVDRRAKKRKQPELAVLVVRASDKIPGQGWWVERNDPDYKGPWEGKKAEEYIRRLQSKAFAYWAKH